MTQNNTPKRDNVQGRDEMKIIEVMSGHTDLVCHNIVIWAHVNIPVLKGILIWYILTDSTKSQFRYSISKDAESV